MKYFTLATALLASAAIALPTPINTPITNSGVSGVTSEVNQVLTITTAEGKSLLVELNSDAKNILSGVSLGSVTNSVGKITQIADSATGLKVSGAAGSTITVALKDGKFALVELTNTVEGLLSGLGLGKVGSTVGTVVSSLGDIESIAARDNGVDSTVQGTLSVVSQTGETLVFKAVPSLLQGLDLTTVTGTVGKVVASVPVVGDLTSKAEELGEDPSQLFGLLSADGASTLLVKVESGLSGLTSTVSGLLSGLGLSSLSSTVGTVVEGATGTVGGTLSNL